MGLWSEGKKSKGRGQRKQHGHEEIQNIMYHAFTHTHKSYDSKSTAEYFEKEKRQ